MDDARNNSRKIKHCKTIKKSQMDIYLSKRFDPHHALSSMGEYASFIDRTIYGILVVIQFDMLAYKKRTNSRAIKKTLSIPHSSTMSQRPPG